MISAILRVRRHVKIAGSSSFNSYINSQKGAKPFYEKLVEINQEKKYTKAHFMESDLELCIEFAGKFPRLLNTDSYTL